MPRIRIRFAVRSLALMAVWAVALPSASAEQAATLLQPIWTSSTIPFQDTDSVAAFVLHGRPVIAATSKQGHRVDFYDAETGGYLRTVGVFGSDRGCFARPNGIAAFTGEQQQSPLLFVVERDNRRVQVIRASELDGVATFGEDKLTRPYGCALAVGPHGCRLFVTDTKVMPTETVKVFDVNVHHDNHGVVVSGTFAGAFGQADGPGRIHKAESIAVDCQQGLLFVCDEHEAERNVKVYTVSGEFTGEVFANGILSGDPEGIVICETDNGVSLIVLAEQRDRTTVLHLFDRLSRKVLGSVDMQAHLVNTDGICFLQHGDSGGRIFAVHDDTHVLAFSLESLLTMATSAKDDSSDSE